MMELPELTLVLPLEIYIHIYSYIIRFINQKYPETNSVSILCLQELISGTFQIILCWNWGIRVMFCLLSHLFLNFDQ